MKKILAVVLTLAMVLSLAACGSKESNDPKQSASAKPASEKPETKAPESKAPESKAPESSKPVSGEGLKVALVTDVGGVNDGSFNQHGKVYKEQKKILALRLTIWNLLQMLTMHLILKTSLMRNMT